MVRKIKITVDQVESAEDAGTTTAPDRSSEENAGEQTIEVNDSSAVAERELDKAAGEPTENNDESESPGQHTPADVAEEDENPDESIEEASPDEAAPAAEAVGAEVTSVDSGVTPSVSEEEATLDPEAIVAGGDSSVGEAEAADIDSSESPPTNDAPRNQLTKRRPGASGRLKSWLGGSTSIGKRPQPPTEPAPNNEIKENPDAQEEVTQTPAQLRKELKALKSSRRSWKTIVKDAEKAAEQSQNDGEHLDRQLRAVNDWISQFDRSYQWRVQQRMDQQLARAKSDLRAYEDSVKNVQEFEPGRLVQLRKRFHKMLGQMFLIVFPLGLLTVLLPILFEIPKVDALEAFYDPQLSAPIILLAVAAVVTAVLLVRRALGRDTVRNLTIAKWIILAIVVGLLVVILPLLEEVVRAELLPFLEEHQWRILGILTAIFLGWMLLSLAVYYQGWSQYRRGVQNQLAKLQAVISGYVESQQEVNRLGLLYRQAGEWLEILAHVLYRPWASHPDWQDSKGIGGDFGDIPFALRIAHVDDETGAKSAELERIIASKLLVQGWRAEAFKDLVHEISQDLGVGADKLSVDQLDKDLPHQTNNTRNILRKHLEASARSGKEGEGQERKNDRYLVRVARKRLSYLIEQTQSVALSAARPQVKQLLHDPLGALATDAEAVGGTDSTQDWDGFLKESLGTEEIVQPPLSILNFTPQGQMNKVGEDPRTFVLIPQRLADALPASDDSDIQMVPVNDDSSRPVEIIARVDVAGPVQASSLRLFSSPGSKQADRSSAATARETVAEVVCPSCHDPSCPASQDARKNCVNQKL